MKWSSWRRSTTGCTARRRSGTSPCACFRMRRRWCWTCAENLPAYPFDPNKAKQLLDQAGYRDPDGDGPQPRFSLTFKSSTNQEANLRAEMMQQMLRNVGIDMKIQTSELGTFLEDIGKGNFQMYSLSRNGIADPDWYYILFHSA